MNLWNLADFLRREVSVLFDSEDKVWFDVGTSGRVRNTPEGAIIPFKLWIHTHPWDAYWSSTDLNSLMQFSGILNEAIVLKLIIQETIHSRKGSKTTRIRFSIGELDR